MITGFFAYNPHDEWNGSRCTDEADLVRCLKSQFDGQAFPIVLEYEIDGYCRDRTEEMRRKYERKAVLDYPEDGDWKPLHSRYQAATGAFGRR